MNIFDILILVILVAFALKGLLRGLMKELCTLVGLVAGALLAFHFHQPLAASMQTAFSLPQQLCAILAFLAIFLLTMLLFSLVGMVLSRYVKLMYVGGLNRVAGGLFGLIQGLIVISLLVYALTLRPLPAGLDTQLEVSVLAPPFIQLGEQVFAGSSEFMPEEASSIPPLKN
jgi:membrane protein required for colicin V production